VTLEDIQEMTTIDQMMGLSYLALSSQCLDEHETKLLCEFDPGLNKPIEVMLDARLRISFTPPSVMVFPLIPRHSSPCLCPPAAVPKT
jgi:hypothetical protein